MRCNADADIRIWANEFDANEFRLSVSISLTQFHVNTSRLGNDDDVVDDDEDDVDDDDDGNEDDGMAM